ncbi:hypothetical protein Ocin01_08478 [Orchesella cincta]|uniref:Uncharacterized protein n=1 Tax=Orchesella cincta TaxID=48709 RepID=A0A1D2MZ35_ORCCI|nr:hypothetical protein Ocin01_08478 [Orchesella cincta]
MQRHFRFLVIEILILFWNLDQVKMSGMGNLPTLDPDHNPEVQMQVVPGKEENLLVSCNFNLDSLDKQWDGSQPPSCITYSESPRKMHPTSAQDLEVLRHKFLKFLTRFGSEISVCCLQLQVDKMDSRFYETARRFFPLTETELQRDPLTLYKLVHSYLSLMPNLNSLEISGDDLQGYIPDQHNLSFEMNSLLETQPLPPLKKLVMLTIWNLPNPLENGLLLQYNLVQKLSLKCRPFTPLFPDSLKKLMMVNLEELEVSPCGSRDFTKLQNISLNPTWPLKCLRIEFRNDDFERILVTLNHFGSTLRHVHLWTTVDLEEARNLHKVKLQLPFLETLKMELNVMMLSSIDFILPCTALKQLELEVPEWSWSGGVKTEIQFRGFATRMYESNIWKKMCNLESLKLKLLTEGWDLKARSCRLNEECYNYTKVELRSKVVQLQ